MRDLTRAEQEELIRLLRLVVANGRGAVEIPDERLSPVIVREINRLADAATLVHDACVLDLQNREG